MDELTWINPHDPLFAEWVALRHRILRAPLGLAFSETDLEAEKSQRHLVSIEDNRINGGLVVVPLEGKVWKIRQVAVEDRLRGQGLGRRLMERMITEAREENIQEIVLHSRSVAVGFYERLGFTIVGPEFEEVGIPHRKMTLPLSSA